MPDTANQFIFPSYLIIIITCFIEAFKLDLLMLVNLLKYIA